MLLSDLKIKFSWEKKKEIDICVNWSGGSFKLILKDDYRTNILLPTFFQNIKFF